MRILKPLPWNPLITVIETSAANKDIYVGRLFFVNV